MDISTLLAQRSSVSKGAVFDRSSDEQSMGEFYSRCFDAPAVDVGGAQVGGQSVRVWCIGPLEGNDLYVYGTENAQSSYLNKPFNYIFYSQSTVPQATEMMIRLAGVRLDLDDIPSCLVANGAETQAVIEAACSVWHRADGLMVSRPFHEDVLVQREDDESAEFLFGMVNLLTDAELSAADQYESVQELENRMADDGFEFVFSGDRPNFGSGQ